MARITRDEFLAGLVTVNTIQSVTWPRRVDKVVNRCSTCNAETASHSGERFCNNCDSVVATYRDKVAEAGDLVRMQFIPRINPNGTKNWTPAGGFLFNAPTQADADRIKRRAGLFQCTKFTEQIPENQGRDEAAAMVASGDLRGVPRCFGVDDIRTWTAEGVTHEIVG